MCDPYRGRIFPLTKIPAHGMLVPIKTVKRLLLVLVVCLPALAGDKPNVSDCFKVHSLTRMDDEHYWANWTNACPYTIDSVYVMIGFADKSRKLLGEGDHHVYRNDGVRACIGPV